MLLGGIDRSIGSEAVFDGEGCFKVSLGRVEWC